MSCGPRICGDFLAKPTVGSDLVSSWRGRRSAGYDSAPVAYAVAFRLSCGQVFFSPAAQSLLPSVVDGDEIVAANSGIWTAAVTAQILVAPVAVLLAVHVGFGVVFAVNAVSAVVLRGLREPERTTPVQVSSPLAHAGEGLAALAALPLLKALAAGQFLAALSAGAPARCSSSSPRTASVVAAASGCWLRRSVPAPHSGRFTPHHRPPPPGVRVRSLRRARRRRPRPGRGHQRPSGRLRAGVVRPVDLQRQRHLHQDHPVSRPEDLRGRAFAGFDVLWQAGRLLSLLGGGLLADAVGIQAVYLLGGLLLLTAAAVGLTAARAAAGTPGEAG